MMTARHLVAATTVLLLLAGCKPDVEYPEHDAGTDYFPIGEGRWIQYDVDSVYRFDVGGIHDSIGYSLREVQVDPFTDPEGRPAMRLHRLRQDSALNWNVQDVWWQVRTDQRVERSEENQRRVKLILPPAEGLFWNTNATNTGEPYELTYEEVDVPWSVNGMNFEHTLLVKTTYPNNLIINRTYYERYAKGVGLVYRQVDSTNTQWNTALQQYQVTGTWYRQVITAHGQ